MNTRMSMAVHEAGHALMAAHFKLLGPSVVLIDDHSGHCETVEIPEGWPRQMTRSNIAVSMAGPIAQLMIESGCESISFDDAMSLIVGGADDLACAWRWCHVVTPEDPTGALEETCNFVLRHLHGRQRTLLRVAQALYEKGRLEHREVIDLIYSAPARKPATPAPSGPTDPA